MSFAAEMLKAYAFNRSRTLAVLETVEKEPDPRAALGWRPGPGRAHIGWQLMHIGVTEEIFATERLAPEKSRAFEELWPRFRGGSTPDDQIPTAEQIRRVLEDARQHLTETLLAFSDSKREEVVLTLRDRPFTFEQTVYLIGFHEAHHQGQAHTTFNSYKAAKAK